MTNILLSFVGALVSSVKSRRELVVENFAIAGRFYGADSVARIEGMGIEDTPA